MSDEENVNTEPAVADGRRAALAYLDEAWEEALLDGIAPDCVAHAALFAALKELVLAFGEEATARFAEKLPERIREGGYTLPSLPH
ncbi:hypothetical protein IHQ68_14340 [Chelatococcus sambhunathii]|uniref:DUF2267 domain-containing protein n=1 Tax=Chelatococcus sambhunathii TaxID=363953 RepID=A0ABU1DI60_9HYPH|nr:hypothetical protein [Chelatococcus sambhunathii]MDR4307800.1 hypothetical protein [Chelatococcus sambhunathii]